VKGGSECLTREQLAERAATEKRQKQELQQWQKETTQTEKWLQQQLVEEKKAADAKRLAEAQEAAQLQEQKRLQELAQKQAAAIITTIRNGTFHPNARHWSNILKDTKQPIQMRQLAASILRKELPSGKNTSAQDQNSTIRNISAEKTQLKPPGTTYGKCGQVSPCSAKMSFDACMQAEMNDPNECLAQRQIAAIAIGKDPQSITAQQNANQSHEPAPDAKNKIAPALNPGVNNVLAPPPPPRDANNQQTQSTTTSSNKIPQTTSTFTDQATAQTENAPKQPKPLTLGISKSVQYSAAQTKGQSGGLVSEVDVAAARGSVTASVGPKSVSADLEANVTAVHGAISYKTVTFTDDIGTAGANASGYIGTGGAWLSVGGGAALVSERVDDTFHVGKLKVDLYAEGSIGVDAHLDAAVIPKNVTLDAAVGPVGAGVDLSVN